jgi:hypothetical protein
MQVDDCELPKNLIGQPTGDKALGRPFIEEGSSRTGRSDPSWVKYVNLFQREVWLDM